MDVGFEVSDLCRGRLQEIEDNKIKALKAELEKFIPYEEPYDEVLREEDLNNLPPAMRHYKSKISKKKRKMVGKTCLDVD